MFFASFWMGEWMASITTCEWLFDYSYSIDLPCTDGLVAVGRLCGCCIIMSTSCHTRYIPLCDRSISKAMCEDSLQNARLNAQQSGVRQATIVTAQPCSVTALRPRFPTA